MSQLRVISYDIVDDKKRAKAANILKDFGKRVQYSVFECRIKEEQLAELKKRLTKAIDLEEDSVLIYTFCAECNGKIISLGAAQGIHEDPPDFFVV